MFFALCGINNNSTASLPHLKPRSRDRTFETRSQIVLHWFWHRADAERMTGKSQGKVCRPLGQVRMAEAARMAVLLSACKNELYTARVGESDDNQARELLA
jgi:hypothetical protein